MTPILSILPKAQKKLWPMLSEIPKNFVLYGGTAIALQLGHRESVDFDFFSSTPLQKDSLLNQLNFLNDAKLVHPEINTLNCYLSLPEGEVKLQFLAGLGDRHKRVADPVICDDNNLQLASLKDLLGSKLNTIQSRAEIKDYVDIDTLLKSGLSLAEGLGCARAIFGVHFDPGSSIRALCSYRDGDLSEIDEAIKQRLINAALSVETVPNQNSKSGSLSLFDEES